MSEGEASDGDLVAEIERLRRHLARMMVCAVCDDISDPFAMMVGLCYRHAAEIRHRCADLEQGRAAQAAAPPPLVVFPWQRW